MVVRSSVGAIYEVNIDVGAFLGPRTAAALGRLKPAASEYRDTRTDTANSELNLAMSTANCIDRLAPNSPGLAPWVHCLWEKRAAMAQCTTHSKPVSTYISLCPSKNFDGSATDCRAARLDAVLITTKVLQPYRPGHLPSSLRVALLQTSTSHRRWSIYHAVQTLGNQVTNVFAHQAPKDCSSLLRRGVAEHPFFASLFVGTSPP